MNWNNYSTFFPSVLRPACLLCAFFLLVNVEPVNAGVLELNDDKLLVIGDGEVATTVPLDSNALKDLTEMMGIVVEKEGTLLISPKTMVYLGGGYIAVKGTLQLESTLGTGIYSSTEPWDGVNLADLQPDRITNLVIDGGTIEISKGVDNVLFANTINVTLGSGGGTIDIVAGVTMETGTISGQTGNVLKTGDGILHVNKVSMGEIFEVQKGNVVFLDGATVGRLNSSIGTVISGLHADGENKSNLTVIGGGKIEGTLQDIDRLLLGADKFTFTGGSHSIEAIDVVQGATLDIKAGTNIQLGATDTKESYDDMIIEGKLQLSGAAGTLDKANSTQPVHMTIVGTTNSVGEVVGGIVEVYKNDSNPAVSETLTLDSLHTQVIGMGQIFVQNGVTFQSGRIDIHPDAEGAHIIVTGGGTYQAAEVDIGTGYFIVEQGTTMDFLKTAKAGALISEAKTHINTYGNAEFGVVNIAGTYEGNNQNLTLKEGGWVTGSIAGVKELTLEKGTLFLAIDATKPTISVEKFIVDPSTTQIRTIAGTASGTYGNVIEVAGSGADTAQLLAILNASHTALYRPQWSQSGTSLDLKLDILTVDEYISNVWGRKDRNAGNIGKLIEDVSLQNASFRGYLEGLPDAQLQSTIRNAMAGELAGNAYRIAMYQPAHSVFRHLDTVVPLRSPLSTRRHQMRGQVREGFNVWFNPYGQAEQGDGESDTFDGYKLSRYGFHLGGDIEIYNRAVFGAFFGYATPNVKSDLGKISADDYTAGLYLRMPILDRYRSGWVCCSEEDINYGLMLNMMIGFGNQDYTYKNSYDSTDFHGSSIFGSMELTNSVGLPFHFGFLTPLIALDFQSAQMGNFIALDPVLGGVLVEPESLSSAMVRVGLLGDITPLRLIRTRLQYMRQIAGDDVVFSRTSVLGDIASATQVRSTQWGKDWLNVGIGGDLTLRRFRYWQVFVDYDFTMSSHTTSHIGSINTVLKW